MHVARPALATLVGVVVALLVGTPALAATSVRLTLSASHGAPGAPVTATFSYPSTWGWFGRSCDGPVTFGWDGHSVAQVDPGLSSSTCSASVTLTPSSSTTGSHVVSGSAPNAGSAQATYTIDAPAGATPSVRPSPSPTTASPPGAASVPVANASPSAQPSPSRSALPSASAQPSPSTRPSAPAGAPSRIAAGLGPDDGVAPPADGLTVMDAPAAVGRPATSTPLGVWILLAGGALVLLGAVLVALVRFVRRRKRITFAV